MLLLCGHALVPGIRRGVASTGLPERDRRPISLETRLLGLARSLGGCGRARRRAALLRPSECPDRYPTRTRSGRRSSSGGRRLPERLPAPAPAPWRPRVQQDLTGLEAPEAQPAGPGFSRPPGNLTF